MVSTPAGRLELGTAGRSFATLRRRLVSLALRLTGSALPLHLAAADRAELERTIRG
jgi:hypothetical protein